MTPLTYVYAYFAKPCLAEENSSNDLFFLIVSQMPTDWGKKSKEPGSVWDLFLPLSSLEWNVLFKFR